MTDPDADDPHYTLSLINHQTDQQLKVELVDLPFPARSYRVRINDEWARRVPAASKTAVMRQLRQWWVAQYGKRRERFTDVTDKHSLESTGILPLNHPARLSSMGRASDS